MQRSNKLLIILKLGVSMATLAIVVRTVNLHSLYSIASIIDYRIVVTALLIFWATQLVSSLRCVYIANELGKKLPFSASTRAHFVGLWFNQILPTSLGGDILKIAILRQSIGFGNALATTILDRFSGLFILMLVILVTLPLYANILPEEQNNLIYFLASISTLFILTTIVLGWMANKIKISLSNESNIVKLIGHAANIWLFRRAKPLWRQLWTSSIIHFNGIIAYALLGKALGLNIDLLTFLLIVPLIFLIALLPISFAGWGIREVGAIWLFGLVGISKENALILSVSYGLLLIIAGLPGLLFINRSASN